MPARRVRSRRDTGVIGRLGGFLVHLLAWCLTGLFRFPSFRRYPKLTAAVTLLLVLELGALLVGIGARSLRLALLWWVVCAGLTVLLLCWQVIRLQNRQRLKVRRLETLLALTPDQFERAIAELLHDLGYRDIRIVGRAGDLGADILCRDRDGRSVAVQCKRRAPGSRISSPDLQTFIGMLQVHHKADVGIFVSTSEFTAPARQLADLHGIRLFDGPALAGLLIELAETK